MESTIEEIIKSTVQDCIKKLDPEAYFSQEIPFLKEFEFKNKKETQRGCLWFFEACQIDYRIRFFIFYSKVYETWRCRIVTYWKHVIDEPTEGAGMDFDNLFGPYSSYNEMVADLNIKLTNHILLSPHIFQDDNSTAMGEEIITMIKLLKSRGQELEKLQDPIFDELKLALKEMEGKESKEELLKYIDDKCHEVNDKQAFMMQLQRLHNINYHQSIDRFNGGAEKSENLRKIMR